MTCFRVHAPRGRQCRRAPARVSSCFLPPGFAVRMNSGLLPAACLQRSRPLNYRRKPWTDMDRWRMHDLLFASRSPLRLMCFFAPSGRRNSAAAHCISSWSIRMYDNGLRPTSSATALETSQLPSCATAGWPTARLRSASRDWRRWPGETDAGCGWRRVIVAIKTISMMITVVSAWRKDMAAGARGVRRPIARGKFCCRRRLHARVLQLRRQTTAGMINNILLLSAFVGVFPHALRRWNCQKDRKRQWLIYLCAFYNSI